jgi:hypothetical protein
MSRGAAFYFGSVTSFVGLLLLALGVSKIIGQVLDLLPFAELTSGFVLIVIGFRATRPVQRESP